VDLATEDTAPAALDKAPDRVFLVVLDDTPELKVALRYACKRAQKTGGRVALLYVIEDADFQQWLRVGEIMRDEARQAAEQLMQKMAAEVYKISGKIPVLVLREGSRRDELLKLIDEDPTISILVLGAATGAKGPGPLVSELTGKLVGRLRIPVTIVPGNLSVEAIDRIA
jgi:nucleotide-binding universal stress UspA family protein